MEQFLIPENLFALEVTDNSLHSFGIEPGDLVLVDPAASNPEPGQLVLVGHPNGSLGIKRWQSERDGALSDPVNNGIAVTQSIGGNARVAGIVRGIWRIP